LSLLIFNDCRCWYLMILVVDVVDVVLRHKKKLHAVVSTDRVSLGLNINVKSNPWSPCQCYIFPYNFLKHKHVQVTGGTNICKIIPNRHNNDGWHLKKFKTVNFLYVKSKLWLPWEGVTWTWHICPVQAVITLSGIHISVTF